MILGALEVQEDSCASGVPASKKITGCFYEIGEFCFVGFLKRRALLFRIQIRAPDCWKFPFGEAGDSLLVNSVGKELCARSTKQMLSIIHLQGPVRCSWETMVSSNEVTLNCIYYWQYTKIGLRSGIGIMLNCSFVGIWFIGLS